MPHAPLQISSLTNPRVKRAVKLRQRSHRDALELMLIEGYRELLRAVDNGHSIIELFFCRDLFQGVNETPLIEKCRDRGAILYDCTPQVFKKLAYRDRPEGLLAVAPPVKGALAGLVVPPDALIVVAEAVEKPGNLGTILRTADAAGVHAVIVCDRCTDVNNPNVVRASIGTVFSLPVIETSTAEAQAWLQSSGITTLATTPHAERLYTDIDLRGPTALVLGTEQYGLSESWLSAAKETVRIPMLGQADSLNVAAATTIVLYEAVRQRRGDAPPSVPSTSDQTPP